MQTETNFAVVDLETTGLYPNGADRVIEVAVINMDSRGKILNEYCTLINPKRDVSMTQIHGISARDVKNAPIFSEIAGDLLSLLAGAVFVAHNVNFDIRFIHSEFKRIGCYLPDFPHLCTMQLAHKADSNIPSRRLGELCKYFNIELSQAHSALEDAKATAKLLITCLSRLSTDSKQSFSNIGIAGQPITRNQWPTLPITKITYTRSQASQEYYSQPSYIAQLVFKLPAMTCSEPVVEDYLMLLDRVLEDRRVSTEESEALYTLAHECGISRVQATNVHKSYIRDLIQTALEDSVITESEGKDLEEVRRLLAIPEDEYQIILKDLKEAQAHGDFKKSVNASKSFDVKGMSVCFTGELKCRIRGEVIDRLLAEKISAEKGMVVKGNVAKTLDFLVAGDPDSISGKANKAREYGIRIISEPVFWQMLGIQVE